MTYSGNEQSGIFFEKRKIVLSFPLFLKKRIWNVLNLDHMLIEVYLMKNFWTQLLLSKKRNNEKMNFGNIEYDADPISKLVFIWYFELLNRPIFK